MRILPSTRTLPLTPPSALETIHRLGFEAAELSYNSFEHSGMDYPSYPNMLRLSLLAAARLGLRVPVVHAPWEDYFLPYLGRGVEAMVREAVLLAEIAYGYGVEAMVFHPFSQRRVGSGRALWLNKLFFSMLGDSLEAEGIEVTVAVENTSRAAPWNRVENVRHLVEQLASERVRTCLDIGHAGLNGYQPGAAAQASGKPYCIHIHDNHGERDEHLVPGSGGLDWETLTKEDAVNHLYGTKYAVAEVDCREQLGACRTRLRVGYEAAKLVLRSVLE